MTEILQNLGEMLKTAPPHVAYLIMLAAGVMTSFTPCVYPIIPLTVGFIGAQARESRSQGFFLSLLFTLGMAIVYAVAGAIAAQAGAVLGAATQSHWAYLFVGVVFLLMGMSMLDVFQLQTPRSLQKLQTVDAGGKYLKPILVGMVSAIVIGPCTGPVVLVFLTHIWQKSSIVYGASMLFAFGLGLGALVILAGTFAGFLASMPKSGEWTERIKRGFGWLMAAAAVFVIFKAGQMSYGVGASAVAGPVEPSDRPVPVETAQCDPPAVPVAGLETKHALGKLAPEIALPSPHGQTIRLSEHLGKVVVMAFWSADCTKCMAEVPELNELQSKHASQCFTVLGVNTIENLARTGAVARQKGMTYPVVAASAEGAEAPEYNVFSVPLLLVVDRWGVITWEGAALTEEFHRAVEEALAADAKLPRGEQAAPTEGSADAAR